MVLGQLQFNFIVVGRRQKSQTLASLTWVPCHWSNQPLPNSQTETLLIQKQPLLLSIQKIHISNLRT